MPAYYTRSGARAAPANPPPGAADNTVAGAVQGPADHTQADPDLTNTGSPGRSSVTGNTEGNMATFPITQRPKDFDATR